jgi:hypothetical protein
MQWNAFVLATVCLQIHYTRKLWVETDHLKKDLRTDLSMGSKLSSVYTWSKFIHQKINYPTPLCCIPGSLVNREIGFKALMHWCASTKWYMVRRDRETLDLELFGSHRVIYQCSNWGWDGECWGTLGLRKFEKALKTCPLNLA